MKKLIAVALLSLSVAFVGVGCTTDTTENNGGTQQPNSKKGKNSDNKKPDNSSTKKNEITAEMAAKIEAAEKEFVVNYANLALSGYKDSLEKAKELQKALNALADAAMKADATEATVKPLLDAAQTAWKESRVPYLQTEIFRFYDGPINMNVKYESDKYVKVESPDGAELEPLINAWPLDEAFIDYVQKGSGRNEDAYKESIIGKTDEPLTKNWLLDLNENPNEDSISVGYHAIEFMLWGQDLSDTTAGERPVKDFISVLQTDPVEKKRADRRCEYIKMTADILVEQLDFIVKQWEDGADNFRKEFLANPKESTVKATNALRLLVGFETGGERIAQALISQDQEDEHSCFSDNTHIDMIEDIQGMLNVYNGTYKKVDGSSVGDAAKGLKSVFAARDADLAKTIGDDLDEAHKAAKAAQSEGRFDQLIKQPETAKGYQALNKIFVALNQKAEKSIFKMQDLLKFEVECEKDEIDGKVHPNKKDKEIHAKKAECQKKKN